MEKIKNIKDTHQLYKKQTGLHKIVVCSGVQPGHANPAGADGGVGGGGLGRGVGVPYGGPTPWTKPQCAPSIAAAFRDAKKSVVRNFKLYIVNC